jgi:osmotically-inducible protein OsmY
LPEPQSDFSGYGPKYQRSDARLREQVCDRLTSDPFVDATDIDVRVEHREVTLEGLVRTRNQRRRAEDVAASIGGVSDVMNRLRYE